MNAGLMFGRGERRYEVALVGVRGDLGVEQPDCWLSRTDRIESGRSLMYSRAGIVVRTEWIGFYSPS